MSFDPELDSGGSGWSDGWVPPDQLLTSALPSGPPPQWSQDGPSLDPGFQDTPPGTNWTPPDELIAAAMPPPPTPEFPAFQPNSQSPWAGEYNAGLSDALTTHYAPAQAAPIEGTPEATSAMMDQGPGPAVMRVPIDPVKFIAEVRAAMQSQDLAQMRAGVIAGDTQNRVSEAALHFGITQGIRDANPGLSDEQILAKMGWTPGQPLPDLSGNGGPAADIIRGITGPAGAAMQAADTGFLGALASGGLVAQKVREQLDPKIRYTASQQFDQRMAEIARERGVAANDPSLAGERIQVAKSIFDSIENVQPGETWEQAQKRSTSGLASGSLFGGNVGIKEIAPLANPAYFVGPAEAKVAGEAGLRAARAVAGTRYATEEIGKGLGDLALKGVVQKLGEDARSTIEKWTAQLGDNPAALAHHPEVRPFLKNALVADGEAPTAGNMTQVVKAVLDEKGAAARTTTEANVPQNIAFTPRGQGVSTKYEAVEAKDLVTSHDTQLRPNPDFPAELQPRDRGRAASAQQLTDFKANLEPERLGGSATVGEGAPIVGPDNVVESGNMRSIGLKAIYEEGHPKGQAYKDWLAQNADRFGLKAEDVSAMENPVLVRRRTAEMGPGMRADFVRQANEPAVAQMSATERAASDSRAVTSDLLGSFNPEAEITSASNRDFARNFIEQVVPPNERGALVDAQGALSQEGVTRVRNAIFHKAYDDSGALEKMAESVDSNVRNVSNGMIAAAPKMAALADAVKQGAVFPGLDITGDIAQALRRLSQLRSEGTSVDIHLSQMGLFGNDLSPVAADLLKIFDEHKGSSKWIGDFLNKYADEVTAAGNPAQSGLFGDIGAPTPLELLQKAAPDTNFGRTAEALGQGPLPADAIVNAETLSQRMGVPETAPQNEQNNLLAKAIEERKAAAAAPVAEKAAPSAASTVEKAATREKLSMASQQRLLRAATQNGDVAALDRLSRASGFGSVEDAAAMLDAAKANPASQGLLDEIEKKYPGYIRAVADAAKPAGGEDLVSQLKASIDSLASSKTALRVEQDRVTSEAVAAMDAQKAADKAAFKARNAPAPEIPPSENALPRPEVRKVTATVVGKDAAAVPGEQVRIDTNLGLEHRSNPTSTDRLERMGTFTPTAPITPAAVVEGEPGQMKLIEDAAKEAGVPADDVESVINEPPADPPGIGGADDGLGDQESGALRVKSTLWQTMVVNNLLSLGVGGLKLTNDIVAASKGLIDIVSRPLVDPLGVAGVREIPDRLKMLYGGMLRGLGDAGGAFRDQTYHLGDTRPSDFQRILNGEAGPTAQKAAQATQIVAAGQVVPRLISGFTAVFGRGWHDLSLFDQGLEVAAKDGLQGDGKREFALQFVADHTGTDLATDPIAKAAWEEANRRTWTNSSPITKLLGNLRDPDKIARTWGKDLPAGARESIANVAFSVTPFVNVTSNLAARGNEFIPGANIVGLFRKGGASATEMASRRTSAVMGAAGLTVLGMKAANGEITGDGPSDDNARIALIDQGWKPNSVKIGDRWFENRAFGPFATVLNTVGNYHDQMMYDTKPQDREQITTKVITGLTAFIKANLDHTHFVDSLTTLAQTLQKPTPSAVDNAIVQIADMVTPQGGNAKWVERLVEPRTPRVITGAGNDVRLGQLYRRQFPGSGLPPGVQRPYSGAEQAFPLLGEQDTTGQPSSAPQTIAPAKPTPYVPPLPPRQ